MHTAAQADTNAGELHQVDSQVVIQESAAPGPSPVTAPPSDRDSPREASHLPVTAPLPLPGPAVAAAPVAVPASAVAPAWAEPSAAPPELVLVSGPVTGPPLAPNPLPGTALAPADIAQSAALTSDACAQLSLGRSASTITSAAAVSQAARQMGPSYSRAPQGAVWTAAYSGDLVGLKRELARGGSTEEADEVRREWWGDMWWHLHTSASLSLSQSGVTAAGIAAKMGQLGTLMALEVAGAEMGQPKVSWGSQAGRC